MRYPIVPAVALALTACAGDPTPVDPTPPPTGEVTPPPPTGDCPAPLVFEGGTINEATTWSPAGGDCPAVLITGDVDVDADLTVLPGTVVHFDLEARLSVSTGGSLDAQGTADAPIRFVGTQAQPGWWDGVHILSDRVLNRLHHVHVEDAGAEAMHSSVPAGGLVLGRTSYGASVQIQDCSLSGNAGFGAVVHGGSSIEGWARNTSTGNDAAAHIGPAQLVQLDADSQLTGNADDRVVVTAGTLGAEGTIPALDVPYELEGLEVDTEGTVVIAAGAVFEVVDTASVELRSGAFQLDGTEQQPIHFRGTQAQPGWWRGLFVRGSSDSPLNRMTHVIVEHGGHSAHHSSVEPAGLTMARTSYTVRMDVTGLTLRDNEGYGLYLHANAGTPVWSALHFEGNTGPAAAMPASNLGAVDGASSAVDNGVDALVITGGAVEQDATWVDAGMPYQVDDDVEIEAQVTIEAGAAFTFASDRSLRLYGGRLDVTGTAAAPVTFSGTVAEAGWWDGIFLRDTTAGTSTLSHIVVEHAGRNSFHSSLTPAGIAVGRTSYVADVSITDATVSDIGRPTNSDASGIVVHSNSTANADLCTANTFSGIHGTLDCVLP